MRGPAPSLCLVAPPGPGIDLPIRRHVLRVAATLGQAGWRVHILWCGADALRHDAHAASGRVGATCSWLGDFSPPAPLTLDGPYLSPALHDADRVLHALRRLQEEQHFDLIEFPERGGLGFRAVQAKDTGLAFAEVPLLVTLHGPSVALRHVHQQWLSQTADLALDYAERYAFEHADGQFAAWPGMLDVATRQGWSVQPDAAEVSLDPDELAAGYHRALLIEGSTPTRSVQPLVTVSVAYYNLGDYLEEALESIDRQTYSNLDVVVINDGSTDARAIDVFEKVQERFPTFRFLSQENLGIGATRNRGLCEARGDYFLPMDADNVAHPDMVQRLVESLEWNTDIAALTCYFLAFRTPADLAAQRYAYAYKPTGGPRVLGCLQNVYGDGNALFRADALRAVGGFETERATSFEDWEVFVKLVNTGLRVEVLPIFLFYYRHRDDGFSRVTSGYRNHQRVLRRFIEIEDLPTHERLALWNLLAGSQHELQALLERNQGMQSLLGTRRHRWVDRIKTIVGALTGSGVRHDWHNQENNHRFH